jgi:phasin family protein
MANPRHEDKSNQAAPDAFRQMSEKTADETRRIGETAVEAGQEVARAGADLLQQNAETLQSTLRFGLDMATAVMGRSTDHVSRALGLSGNEVQQSTERTARNAATILHSSTALAKGMQGMSQEYFAFLRHQIENSMERMNELWRCRTPQDIAAVQSDFMRESVESAMESGQRIADMSLKVTNDTARSMAQNMDRRAA